MKGKGERERYTQLNATFWRKVRRYNNAKKQRKTIEWERLEISLRKLEMIKDRNNKDLTEAEGIKKRQQENNELYKKDLNDLDNHNGVLPCQSWTSWNVKSSGPQVAFL